MDDAFVRGAFVNGAVAAGDPEDLPVLAVEGLSVELGGRPVLRSVGLDLHPGEIVGIVGPSGAGKSVLSRALVGLVGAGARVLAERFDVRLGDGRVLDLVQSPSLVRARERDWRRVLGGEIGLVLQDALVALDPLRTVGEELDEAMGPRRGPRASTDSSVSRADRRARAVELLRRAGLADAETFLDRRADELSGGQRQRALIATALAQSPRILVADEPTASLDPTTRDGVLSLFSRLASEGLAIVLVSHDLEAIGQVATVVRELRDGELGPPVAPATLTARRSVEDAGPPPIVVTEGAPPALVVRSVSKSFPGASSPRSPRAGVGRVDAVVDASFEIARGETLGLVGESGSGKSTLGRLVLGLSRPDSGTIELADARPGAVGMVPQDALSSFDPRRTVRQILADAITRGRSRSTRGIEAAFERALDEVGLPRDVADARPLHLSGGQRQRVAIARALAAEPSLLVCDEAVSALDPATRDDVLALLERIRDERGLSMLFISHDPFVTARMSHRILRMTGGRIG